jgi:hypothetical protein
MIKLISIPFLMFASLAHSAPLSWPLDAVAQIQRARTVKDMTCASHQSSASRELCELFIKDHSLKKNLEIETINDSTLMLRSGGISVKLERTGESMKFMVNDRLIDLAKYSNQERLGFAIVAAIRPRETRGFQLIHSAFATEVKDDKLPIVKAAAQSLIINAAQEGNCAAYKELVETCLDKAEPILDYFKKGNAAFRDKTEAKKVIDAKFKAISALLAKADASINIRYGYALNCDCKDDAKQTSCSDEARKKIASPATILDSNNPSLAMRDEKNMTVPRQKGLDRCQRFIQEVDKATTATIPSSTTGGEDILKKIDEKVLGIKAEASGQGTDAGANK